VVRPPGFEPGSTAWKADVLDQTRLRSLYMLPESNAVNTLIKLQSSGVSQHTLKHVSLTTAIPG
jgi:hypothetical protein